MFISPISTQAVPWTIRSMMASALTPPPSRACQSFWRNWVQKTVEPRAVAGFHQLEQEAA